ncbi:MAG: aminotransferase class V-fold PLP-dependent enzyme, partial [Bacteroidales bacterium]|nr:aminotransferase class V-fold PLP-dependent enzyme [Bacteroidales bacterium]
RTGTHCTEPIMQHFGITGTVRASFALYNTFEEVDRLVEGIVRAKKMLVG